MNLSPLKTVARKELTDGLRDRRSLYTILATTLFGVVAMTFMLNQVAGQKKAAEEIRLPVVGREHAPVLVSWLQQQSGVEIVNGPADAEAAIRDRKEDFVLVIDKDFAADFAQSKSAPVQVFSDSTRRSTQSKVARLTLLLSHFSAETAALRLIVRGVSPEVVAPLKVQDVDVA